MGVVMGTESMDDLMGRLVMTQREGTNNVMEKDGGWVIGKRMDDGMEKYAWMRS
jgi:hypothetical protein